MISKCTTIFCLFKTRFHYLVLSNFQMTSKLIFSRFKCHNFLETKLKVDRKKMFVHQNAKVAEEHCFCLCKMFQTSGWDWLQNEGRENCNFLSCFASQSRSFTPKSLGCWMLLESNEEHSTILKLPLSL